MRAVSREWHAEASLLMKQHWKICKKQSAKVDARIFGIYSLSKCDNFEHTLQKQNVHFNYVVIYF